MKSHTQHSFTLTRRAMCATGLVLLVSAASAFGQSSSSSGSSGANPNGSYNSSSSDTTRHDSDASSSSMNSNSSTDSATSSGKLSWSDRRFVSKAADDGMAEVQIAQLATQRASNPDVKSFAQKLVDDHTAVNSELTNLASMKNVKLDNDEGKDRAYKRLSNKSGNDFDREFIAHMVDEHEKDIKAFEKASNDAKDPEIRAFASKHLADLREHLQLAQNLQHSTVPTGRMDNEMTPSSSSSSSSSSSTTPSSSTTTTPKSSGYSR